MSKCGNPNCSTMKCNLCVVATCAFVVCLVLLIHQSIVAVNLKQQVRSLSNAEVAEVSAPLTFQEKLDSVVLPSVALTEQEKMLTALDKDLQIKINDIDIREQEVATAFESLKAIEKSLGKIKAAKIGWTDFKERRPAVDKTVMLYLPKQKLKYVLAKFDENCNRDPYHWNLVYDKNASRTLHPSSNEPIYWTDDYKFDENKLPKEAEPQKKVYAQKSESRGKSNYKRKHRRHR